MNVSTLPDQFLQPGILATPAGAASVVWLVTNGIRYFLNFHRKWLPLAVSLCVIVFVQGFSSISWSGVQVLLLVANTFLLAFTAIGVNETIARGGESVSGKQYGKASVAFRSTWFG